MAQLTILAHAKCPCLVPPLFLYKISLSSDIGWEEENQGHKNLPNCFPSNCPSLSS